MNTFTLKIPFLKGQLGAQLKAYEIPEAKKIADRLKLL
jgi:hypothetical protein